MNERVNPENNSISNGLVLVLTGNGKGKTTSALGMVLRAWGHGLKTAVLQFVKSEDPERGESLALQKMGVELLSWGSGFTWQGDNESTNRAAALKLWEKAKEMISSAQYDLIVLDEFSYALKYGWIKTPEVLKILSSRPPGLHVVITGREAPQELLEFSDCAVEMQSLKHHLRRGVRAQPGIEY